MASHKSKILDAVKQVQSKQVHDVTVNSHVNRGPEHANVHQLVFFFKPELTSASGVDFEQVLQSTLDILAKSKVQVDGVKVLGGDHLSKKDIMIQHYGVIASISKNGESAISNQAKETLKSKTELQGAEVLGGHQFLERFPDFNAFSLSVLNDNLGTTRLAGGTYAMKVKVNGKPFLVLNPFSAYQLVPYTTSGNSIVVFEVSSSEPWAKLRSEVCGVTDPKEAHENSIRRNFLNNQSKFGLKEVSKGANGVHMSAGPLEGMVELGRFFEIKPEHTAFGQALLTAGFSHQQVQQLVNNPTLDHDGKKISAFDLTEEKDSAEAVKLLKDFKVAQ